MAHARLSPSNPRWVYCPASLAAEKQYPPEKRGENTAAIDGTGSHLLLEMCLDTRRPDVRADEWLGKTIGVGNSDKPEGWLVEADRAARVQVCLDYILTRYDEMGGYSLMSESKSDIGKYFNRDDWWGTVDVTLTSSGATGRHILEIIDYKDGRGFVDVNNNTQLIAYAAGKLAPFMFDEAGVQKTDPIIKTIRLTIVQPKIENNPTRFIEMDAQTLWNKITELAEAAKRTDAPDPEHVAGEHCRWCRHAKACSAKVGEAMKGLNMVSNITTNTGIDLVDTLQSGQLSIPDMDTDKIAEILDIEPLMNALFTNAREEMTSRLNKGESGHGYALSKGRKSKKWVEDEELVVKKLKGMRFLTEEIYPKSFISPAKAMKKEGLTERQLKRLTEELIEIVEGNPSLIKVNHRKKSVEEMFSDVPDINEPITPVIEAKEDLSNLTFM